MALNQALLKQAIVAEIEALIPAANLETTELDKFASALATAIINHFTANAVPVVNGTPGTLT